MHFMSVIEQCLASVSAAANSGFTSARYLSQLTFQLTKHRPLLINYRCHLVARPRDQPKASCPVRAAKNCFAKSFLDFFDHHSFAAANYICHANYQIMHSASFASELAANLPRYFSSNLFIHDAFA